MPRWKNSVGSGACDSGEGKRDVSAVPVEI